MGYGFRGFFASSFNLFVLSPQFQLFEVNGELEKVQGLGVVESIDCSDFFIIFLQNGELSIIGLLGSFYSRVTKISENFKGYSKFERAMAGDRVLVLVGRKTLIFD